MRRSIGLVVLAVGIIFAGLGLLGAVVCFTQQPGGGAGLIAFLLVGLVGVVLLFVARGLMLGQTPIGDLSEQKGRVGNYLANVLEPREFAGGNYEVLFKP